MPSPDPGWHFGGWTGPSAADLVSYGDGVWSLEVDGERAVTARFVEHRVFVPLSLNRSR